MVPHYAVQGIRGRQVGKSEMKAAERKPGGIGVAVFAASGNQDSSGGVPKASDLEVYT